MPNVTVVQTPTIAEVKKGATIYDSDLKPIRNSAANFGTALLAKNSKYLAIRDPRTGSLVFIATSDATTKPAPVVPVPPPTVEDAVTVLFNHMAGIVLDNMKKENL